MGHVSLHKPSNNRDARRWVPLVSAEPFPHDFVVCYVYVAGRHLVQPGLAYSSGQVGGRFKGGGDFSGRLAPGDPMIVEVRERGDT